MKMSNAGQAKTKRGWMLLKAVCLFTNLIMIGTALAEETTLHFSYRINDPNITFYCDIFKANLNTDPNAIGFTASDLRQPPGPPYDSLAINTRINDINLTQDTRFLDPNVAMIEYSILLTVNSVNNLELAGDCSFTLMNPENLAYLPVDAMVYIKRYDADHNFVARYDLREHCGQLIEWYAADVNSLQGIMQLNIIDKCQATNIDGSRSVDLIDLSYVATNWQKTGSALAGDINDDETVNIYDLIILSECWLR